MKVDIKIRPLIAWLIPASYNTHLITAQLIIMYWMWEYNVRSQSNLREKWWNIVMESISYAITLRLSALSFKTLVDSRRL